MGFPRNSKIPLQLYGHVHLRRKSSMMKYLSYILLSYVILSRFGAIALASENASVSSSTHSPFEGAEINEKTSTSASFPYHQEDVTALSRPENIEKHPEPITPFYTDATSMTTVTTNAISDRTSVFGQLKDRFASSLKEYSTTEVPMRTTKLLVSAEAISLQLMETLPTITTELTDPENTMTWSDDATSSTISVQTASYPRVTMQTIFTDQFSNHSGLFESHLGNDSQRVHDTLWPVKHASVVEGDVILGGLMMVHSREDSITCGPIMPQGGIQALEAMLFTLDQINEFQLLPNITLGAHILDDCDKDTYGLEMAVDFIKVTKPPYSDFRM